MKAYLFAPNVWHRCFFGTSLRIVLACDCDESIGFYVHLSGPYTTETILPALRCVAKMRGFDAGTTGELCSECFPNRALAPVVEPTDEQMASAMADIDAAMDRQGKRMVARLSLAPAYLGDGHPAVRAAAYEPDGSEPEQ